MTGTYAAAEHAMTTSETRSEAATFAGGHLSAVAALMRDLDICILVTRDGERLNGRPMSNNGQVEYDGDTWFFASRDSTKVREIGADPRVELGYVATERGTWISIEADATIDDDVEHKRERWFEDLRRWFPDGPEADDVVLIRAAAQRIRAWGGEQDLDLRRS
jgi:general stress protein 26